MVGGGDIIENIFLKRLLAVGIIVLFVGISVISSNANFLNVNISTDDEVFSIPLDSRDIIYVDDDNTEGPWDGTNEHPYQYIQDGVDNAFEDDKIYVFNGTYYENIIININFIDLTGEDKTTTIIDGSGTDNVIFLDNYGYGVSIHGFTIQNGDIGIYSDSNSNKIYNNIIYKNNGYGIQNWGHYNTISRNNFLYNGGGGFFLDGGIFISNFNNKISYNNFSNNTCGISIYVGLFTIITKNNFINNAKNAYFYHAAFKLPNQWKSNYWDDWDGTGPKMIKGYLEIESKDVYSYDWKPARNPYDITNFQGCGIE